MGQMFLQSEQYLDQLDDGMYAEIGSSRHGDGGSTAIIADWANRRGRRLFTVDIDPVNSQQIIELNIPNVFVHTGTGEDWLTSRIKKYSLEESRIAFLYLDNFDWDWHPEWDPPETFILEQQNRYKDLGFQMNNVNSQRAHLAQMMLALPLMAERSIVACDDTWYNEYWGHYTGKSGAVIPFLLNNGYEVLVTQSDPVYGTILGRGIK